MTIDVSLFVILVALVLLLTVVCVLLGLAHSGDGKNIASMSDTIAETGKNNAVLRAENNLLKHNISTLTEAKDTAQSMATALGDATRIETMRHEAMLISGANLFSAFGASLAYHQVEDSEVTRILMDLEVGEMAFVAATLNAFYGWPGEVLEPEDYTEEQQARAALIRDALSLEVSS